MKVEDDKLVVYTVIMGEKFSLPKVDVAPANVDFICFSNRVIGDVGVWDVRLVEPLLPADLPRSSREYKIRPHIWLGDYNQSLYIDSKVHLIGDCRELYSHLMGDDINRIIGVFEHSFHDTLHEEFLEVLKLNLDADYVIEEQLSEYKIFFSEYLDSKPFWGGMIARRHNNIDCIKSMNDWYANVLRYSRRDQLSLPIALRFVSEDRRSILKSSNFESSFHLWPVGEGVRPDNYYSYFKPQSFLDPRDSAIAERDSAIAERDSAIAERDSIVNSTIWKISKPYRWLRSKI